MGVLRRTALIATVIGALLSGLRPPVFLIILFTVWASAPFAVLLFAMVFLMPRLNAIRGVVYWMSIILAISSLAAYTYALCYPRPSQPAFTYVMVPIASGAVVLIVLSITAVMARRTGGAGRD